MKINQIKINIEDKYFKQYFFNLTLVINLKKGILTN